MGGAFSNRTLPNARECSRFCSNSGKNLKGSNRLCFLIRSELRGAQLQPSSFNFRAQHWRGSNPKSNIHTPRSQSTSGPFPHHTTHHITARPCDNTQGEVLVGSRNAKQNNTPRDLAPLLVEPQLGDRLTQRGARRGVMDSGQTETRRPGQTPNPERLRRCPRRYDSRR